jgi:hypothetical protein
MCILVLIYEFSKIFLYIARQIVRGEHGREKEYG